ncbi:carbonic anhydrase 2-like [Babylonia areolata]|uniref:carbonic anhydrase 2-like n=1 Tax=Babylonia areolata TaxID=304850 RepID=UPI003FD59EBA
MARPDGVESCPRMRKPTVKQTTVLSNRANKRVRFVFAYFICCCSSGLQIQLIVTIDSFSGDPANAGGTGWEYTGPLGPDKWHTQFPECGGRMQSPINIDTTDILYDPQLHSFDLRKYDACTSCSMVLENVNGHTAEVKYSGEPIIISGGSLPDDYVLDQFHFHWGASNNVGSEHMLDNKPAPMEMHIVHHMKKFNRTQSASKPYGLAVLGFFFKVGAHNYQFDNLLVHFRNIIHKDQHVQLESFSLSSLLPKNALSYYRYYGSLTTPPCYETVIWSLFSEKIEISEAQLDVFRTLKTVREGEDKEVAIVNDYRPVQELHERRVTSNDPEVLHDIASELVDQLRDEIKVLQQECLNSGSVAVSGGSCWLLLVAVFLGCARHAWW